jgi:uncharacterized membrane protein YccC
LRVNAMLDWMGEKIWAIVTLVPAVFVAEDSPNFVAIGAMFRLLLIVLVAYLIAMRPFRAAIARCMTAISNLIARKS